MNTSTASRQALMLCAALLLSCATSLESASRPASPGSGPQPVQVTEISEGQLRLSFEPAPPIPAWEVMKSEEAQAVLATFLQALPEDPQFQILLARASPVGTPAPWEARLRAEFFARYGPALLPLPPSLEHSPLFMALRLSLRYIRPGLQDAARELFRSPVFLASVTLSVLVYFSAWMLPEPLFSKAFAATLTARLALAVGLLELRNVALACLQLYREAEAAKTMAELEAVAERFGRALGGVALRVLVMVASFGVAKLLPGAPPGGLGGLLSPPRYAMAGGATLQSATEVSLNQGGPWTPRFKSIFAKAGMRLSDEENMVYLSGHLGPHPEAYHAAVFERLRQAVEDCSSVEACRQSLIAELRRIAQEVCNPYSRLHQLATQGQK